MKLTTAITKQIPFAMAKGLTQTAIQAQTDIVQAMTQVFGRPTPYTVNSTYVIPATKDRLESFVQLKDSAAKGTPAINFLDPEVFGGEPNPKRGEKALQRLGALASGSFIVPGAGLKLDQYGNISAVLPNRDWLPQSDRSGTSNQPFWGLTWQGMQASIQQLKKGSDVDFVIGCVDTRKARRAIDKWVLNSRVLYWLDLANNASSGQFVLGQPKNSANRKKKDRLPTVAELYPEILKRDKKEDARPSCSAAEALTRQEPFINQNLAYQALGMLAQLLRHGSVSYQGGFCNLSAGQLLPLAIRAVKATIKRSPASARFRLRSSKQRAEGTSRRLCNETGLRS